MYELIFPVALIVIGYIAGTLAEKRHYTSIIKREDASLYLPAVSMKSVTYSDSNIRSAEMVYGNVVISIDYFKQLLAGLRNIFGGTVKSYESLMDRARREALLRMKEKAKDANIIINVRIETSMVGQNAHKKSVGCLEAIAYGTALTLNEE